MRCEQVTPYLPGYSGGELRADTHRVVGEHVDDCATCAAAVGRLDSVRSGLASLAHRQVEAPAFLAEAILEHVHQTADRRPVAEVARLVGDHRKQIASAAGTAVVAAGAAYALWRAVRGRRPAEVPAS